MTPDVGEKLFRVARGERPSRQARERTLRAMRATAREEESHRPKAPRSTTVAAVVAAVAMAAGVTVVARHHGPASAPTVLSAEPPRAVHPSVSAPASAPASAPPPPLSAEAPRPRPAPVLAPRPRMSLADETAALDGAQRALEAGDSGRALVLLDRYRQRGGSRMAAEATLLRAEALARSGRGTEARSLAQRFIDQNPGNPLSDRARAIAAKLDPLNDAGAQP